MKRAPPAQRKPRSRDWPKHAVIWAILLVELFPLYMMVQVSFKDNTGFLLNPWLPSAPATWLWENWTYGIRLITPYIANTLLVAGGATLGTVVLALLASYFFARYRMPCSGVLWSAFLVLMLMPSVANIVPLFSLLKTMHLLNTLVALILVGIAGAQVFNIFVLRNFVEDLPKDLFEAAEMDGATHLQQLRNVVVPMSMPIIGTLSILSFIRHWNEFLLPLIIMRDQEKFTLGVGLIYVDGEYVKQWGQIMAAYFIASVPLIIIFLFAMRLFVRGLSQGAIKG
jgi:ABC-type glycerol-3-phosphate transport system permease component